MYVCDVLHLLKNKEITYFLNDNSGMRVLHNFQCTFMLQYIVSVTYTKFLCMDLTIALKSINETQQTASMRLTIIQHNISYIYVTYFQMYYFSMQ